MLIAFAISSSLNTLLYKLILGLSLELALLEEILFSLTLSSKRSPSNLPSVGVLFVLILSCSFRFRITKPLGRLTTSIGLFLRTVPLLALFSILESTVVFLSLLVSCMLLMSRSSEMSTVADIGHPPFNPLASSGSLSWAAFTESSSETSLAITSKWYVVLSFKAFDFPEHSVSFLFVSSRRPFNFALDSFSADLALSANAHSNCSSSVPAQTGFSHPCVCSWFFSTSTTNGVTFLSLLLPLLQWSVLSSLLQTPVWSSLEIPVIPMPSSAFAESLTVLLRNQDYKLPGIFTNISQY